MAALAWGNHGVVTRQELLDAGVSRKEIEWRLRIGALIRIHPGVYRVGHAAPNFLSSYLAAVLACGPRSFLAGYAGAFNFRIIRGAAPTPEVATAADRRIAGVTARRVRRIEARATTRWRSIPTLTVPAILVDLASTMPMADLARAAHEAGVLHKTTPRQVDTVLDHRGNATGAAKLRAVMHGEARVTLSKLESSFLRRLREINRPLPVTNKPAGGRRVDCRWPQHGLTVELDSYGYHNSRYSWEQDHCREREAYARGDEFRRYTWSDVFEDTVAMDRELSGLLPPVGV